MEAGAGECDQLRAANVFLLTSTARHKLFPGGRCYLSAETLTEMRGWVGDIRRLLGSRISQFFSSITEAGSNAHTDGSQDPSDTLQSVKRQSPSSVSVSSPRLLSSSPQTRVSHGVLGLAEAESPNLTYSYSSDEDEDVRGFSTCPRSPRSVDTCLRRRILDRNKHLAFIDSSEEDLTCLDERKESKTDTDPMSGKSYESLVKMMQTIKKQSNNLEDIFKKIDTPPAPPPATPPLLQERLDDMSQIVQSLEIQASEVIQVRLGKYGSQT